MQILPRRGRIERCHKRALKFRRETPFNEMIQTVQRTYSGAGNLQTKGKGLRCNRDYPRQKTTLRQTARSSRNNHRPNRPHLTVSAPALRLIVNSTLCFTWRPWVSKVHVNPIDWLSYPWNGWAPCQEEIAMRQRLGNRQLIDFSRLQ